MVRVMRILAAVFVALGMTAGRAVFVSGAAGEEDMGQTDTVALPKPVMKGIVSLEEALKNRRSARNYKAGELSMQQLSQVLWAAQGITDIRGLRTAPSAGALYPLEVYVVKKDGVFKFRPQGHRLLLKKSGDLRVPLAQAAWGQAFIAQVPVDIVICAVYERVTSKYKDRGVRYTDMEAGHAAQNIHLQAAALGLGSVPVGAFSDDQVSSVLGLPKEEAPLYIIPVGYTR